MDDRPYDTEEEILTLASDNGCSNQAAITCGQAIKLTSSMLAQTKQNCKDAAEGLVQCVTCLSNSWEGCSEEKKSVVKICTEKAQGFINHCINGTTSVETSTEGSPTTTSVTLKEVKETSANPAKELTSSISTLIDQTTREVTSHIPTETDDVFTTTTNMVDIKTTIIITLAIILFAVVLGQLIAKNWKKLHSRKNKTQVENSGKKEENMKMNAV